MRQASSLSLIASPPPRARTASCKRLLNPVLFSIRNQYLINHRFSLCRCAAVRTESAVQFLCAAVRAVPCFVVDPETALSLFFCRFVDPFRMELLDHFCLFLCRLVRIHSHKRHHTHTERSRRSLRAHHCSRKLRFSQRCEQSFRVEPRICHQLIQL